MDNKETKIREMYEEDMLHDAFNKIKKGIQEGIDEVSQESFMFEYLEAEYLEIIEDVYMLALKDVAEIEILIQELIKTARDKLKELKGYTLLELMEKNEEEEEK